MIVGLIDQVSDRCVILSRSPGPESANHGIHIADQFVLGGLQTGRYSDLLRKGGFYQGLVLANLRSERYRITEEILADTQAYVAVQKEINKPTSGWAFDCFMQGFVYLWHHQQNTNDLLVLCTALVLLTKESESQH